MSIIHTINVSLFITKICWPYKNRLCSLHCWI